MSITVGIIGLGFVGSAVHKSFEQNDVDLRTYDKYKNGGIGTFEDILGTNMVFLCLPTLYDDQLEEYDKSAIYETCQKLDDNRYEGVVIVKSTVEPETSDRLATTYLNLQIVHNPEFLSAKTCFVDFHNQKHVVLGKSITCTGRSVNLVKEFYENNYPNAEISLCNSTESESMKCFVNNFYSVKIQFCNELYLLCQSMNIDYDIVMQLMLKNKWINPMHTKVPGTDGKLSYGGSCFPKDTNALLQFMKKKGTPHQVLESVIGERNIMRDDNDNCVQK